MTALAAFGAGDGLVSVIIPAYNAAAYVNDAIRSALQQTWLDREVLVIDDGSSDATPAVVRGFGDQVRYIRQENAGVAAARNRGIGEARGQFIAVLDADDVWLPEKLELQVAELTRDSAIVAVGCGAQLTTHDLKVTATTTPSPASFEDLLLLRGNGGLGGSAPVMRTDVVRSIGGYDTALSTSADLDLAVRLMAAGRTHTLRAPLFLYRQHGTNMHGSVSLMERDMERLLRKARDSGSPAAARLYRRAMARLHEVLAASYWEVGNRSAAARCLATAFRHHPAVGVRAAAKGAARIGRAFRHRAYPPL
jgi:glycosyltransferase involved in cell wall biosynthesis